MPYWDRLDFRGHSPVDHVGPPMFRFTIRDVLWLTALAGLAGAWWVDRNGLVAQVARERDRAVGYQQAFGDLLESEYERTHGVSLPFHPTGSSPATDNR